MSSTPDIALLSRLTVFKQKPSPASCYLIQRNTQSLLEQVYSQTRFNNSTLMKTKALCLLKNIVLLSERHITQHIRELILKLAHLYTQQADSQQNLTLILEVAQLLGSTLDFETVFLTLFDLLRPQMAEQKEKNDNSLKLFINLLILFSKLIIHKQEEQFGPFRHKIMSIIKEFSIKFYESDEGLAALLGLLEVFLPKIRQINDDEESTILFNLLLNIQSTRARNEETKIRCQKTIHELSVKCGFSSVSELYQHQVAPILERNTVNKQYLNWNKTSKQRFQFDTLIRNSKEIIPRHIDKIFEILQGSVRTQNDLEVRIDAQVLIEYILNIQSIAEDLKPFSVVLMKNILIPSIRWKIGSPETKIRKAGILNMITLVTSDLVDEKGVVECLPELLPPLKDCLTDDREPDLRSVALKLIEELLLKASDSVNEDLLRDIYVSLLERLDDSKNQLRIQTTKAINAFLLCRNLKLIPTIFQYLLNGIFVHFDSECDELREKILITLKHACKVDPPKVMQQAQVQFKKMRHTSICQELIEYCQECIDEN